jgi:CDP-4-dehydro-6-deoxyglucose reductase, E1
MTEYKWPLMQDTMTWGDRFKLAKFAMTADRFTQGEKVAEFEKAWSEWLGVNHSIFVTSGSTANFLLLDAVRDLYFKNKKKIKVLVPACTWVTNINPIMQLGMEPVFCDINLYDYSFDLKNAAEIAKKHKIDIVFVTHLLGLPANIYALQGIFPDAYILEDACESHGARDLMNHKVGSISAGSTFSFYYGHHMSTIEGGMICTNSGVLNNLMRMKRSHGMSRASVNPTFYSEMYPEIDPQFLFMKMGYNFRNTELGAVLGLSQLPKLDRFIEIRQKNFRRYIDIMWRFSSDKFHVPCEGYAEEGNSSFCFPLIARDNRIKERLLVKLRACGIEYRPVVGGNLLRQPYMKGHKIACKEGPYNVDIVHENGVYIGNNQFVGKKELDLLEDIIRRV